jgi:hypothetical protein
MRRHNPYDATGAGVRWPDTRLADRAAHLAAPLVTRARGWRRQSCGPARDWPVAAHMRGEAPRAPAPDDFTSRVMLRITTGPLPSAPTAPAPASPHIRRLRVLLHVAGSLWMLALALGFAVALVRPALAFDALHALVLAVIRLLGVLRQAADVVSGLNANGALLVAFATLLGLMLLVRSQVVRSAGRAPREA